MNRISAIIMGNNSYQQILTFGDWAWEGKKTYVFTYEPLTTDRSDIFFVQGDVETVINSIKKEPRCTDIWLLGGADLIAQCAQQRLIDECVITQIPVLLGEGIALNLPYNDFMLLSTKDCGNGLIQKTYHKNIN